jgi:hypothetical protein
MTHYEPGTLRVSARQIRETLRGTVRLVIDVVGSGLFLRRNAEVTTDICRVFREIHSKCVYTPGFPDRFSDGREIPYLWHDKTRIPVQPELDEYCQRDYFPAPRRPLHRWNDQDFDWNQFVNAPATDRDLGLERDERIFDMYCVFNWFRTIIDAEHLDQLTAVCAPHLGNPELGTFLKNVYWGVPAGSEDQTADPHVGEGILLLGAYKLGNIGQHIDSVVRHINSFTRPDFAVITCDPAQEPIGCGRAFLDRREFGFLSGIEIETGPMIFVHKTRHDEPLNEGDRPDDVSIDFGHHRAQLEPPTEPVVEEGREDRLAQESAGPVELMLRYFDSEGRLSSLDLAIPDDLTVLGLKQILHRKLGTPPSRQRIILKGKEQNDQGTLRQVGIVNGSIVHMIEKLR